jgi:hypothetical protein
LRREKRGGIMRSGRIRWKQRRRKRRRRGGEEGRKRSKGVLK